MIPKYILLKDKINQDILSGVYPIDSKLPTENELADLYGVSRSTIRQALDLLVKEEIITKRWGSGNTVISKSDSSKKDTVMVLLPSIKATEWHSILTDISSTLLKEGYAIEAHETVEAFSKEREFLTSMLNEIYAGLIIVPAQSALPSTNMDLMQQLLKRQLPAVFLKSAPDGIYNATVVSTDDYGKGYQMARSFINSGHKSLGGIFVRDNKSSVNTFSGYIDAIRDADLNILDSCFLWCNSHDCPGINTRGAAVINRFVKHASEMADAIYIDDTSLSSEGTATVSHCTLEPARPLGKEAAKTFLELKNNGSAKSTTIAYK